jgi:hypothetical protein
MPELRQHPTAGIAADGGKIADARGKAEARGGDESGGIRLHFIDHQVAEEIAW